MRANCSCGRNCDEMKKLESTRGWTVQINVEIHQALIFFERDELRNVEASASEKFRLALQIEVKEAFGRAVRSDDAAANAGFFRSSGEFGPVLVVTDFFGGREGNGKSRSAGRILDLWAEDDVGNLFGGERRQLLTALVFERQGESNAAKVDANTFCCFVSEHHAKRDDARCERIFLREGGFVLIGAGERLDGNSHAFVGIEG